MRDEIALLQEARPVTQGPDPELAHRVKEELMAGSGAPSERPRRLRRGPLRIAIALGTLVVVAILGTSMIGRGSETAWAAELVRVAEAAPRLLVDDEGWKITRANQFGAEQGEMTFSNGERELELRWQPAGEHASLVQDRKRSADLSTIAPVVGGEARVYRYEGVNDFTAIWLLGRSVLEARGFASDVDRFKAEIAALREVDVDTWLSAMPESVVRPASRAEVVAEMLSDMPTPPGFDASELRRGDAVLDRYQLGAKVSGAVACAWIDRWVSARRSGDGGAVRAAVAAMATSHRWQVLSDMDDIGDYPEVLWELADAISGDTPVSGGKPTTVAQSYRSALGCSSS